MHKTISKAYTLLELLIVIGIISVLLGMGIFSYSGIQKKSRDAKRKSDLKEIQKALELYKQIQNPITYPGALGTPDSVWQSGTLVLMNKMPKDPLSNSATTIPYFYNRPSSLTYTLCACLEDSDDPDQLTSSDNCDAGYTCAPANAPYVLNEP